MSSIPAVPGIGRRAVARLVSASPQGTLTAAARVGPRNGWWLPTRHHYFFDSIGKIKVEARSVPSQVETKRLAEYIACSVPSHCFDGWSYFGRALQALLRGDSGTARHLAYYAELRAAMCILGHQGIGILDRQHYLVNSSGEASYLCDGGTHVVTADLLSEWSRGPSSGRFLSEVVKPGREPLGEWVDQFPVSTSLSLAAQTHFHQWGMDLALLANDRNARNEASYRPRHLAARRLLHPRRAARFVESVWETLEPTGSRYFQTLDIYLLGMTLETMFTSATSIRPQGSKVYTRMVADTADRVVGSGLTGSTITRRLTTADALPFVLAQVHRRSKPGSPSYELQVLARALLLLRLATGAAKHMVDELGLDQATLAPWWTRVGFDLGLWSEPPEDVLTLWEDLDLSVARLAAWRKTNPYSYRDLRSSCAAAQVELSQTELVPVWALAA